MRPWDASAIEALIAAGVPESASLEYKSDLHLGTNGEKTEVAKDLTSIGSGGGGTVLFGVDEDTKDWPAATATAPLTDPSLLSRLENILQDGVRPPLVVSFTRIDVDGGHVLAAEVEPSPLGPYMVELYGERRFHIRDGNRTRRMTETEVSQAYALPAQLTSTRRHGRHMRCRCPHRQRMSGSRSPGSRKRPCPTLLTSRPSNPQTCSRRPNQPCT
jgi:predicted HTH transcriptional regulator